MVWIIYILLMIAVSAVIFGYWYFFIYEIDKKNKFEIPNVSDLSSYEQKEYSEISPFNQKNLTWEGQTEHWQNTLKDIAHQFKESQVHSIYLIHGTFVGTDPFDIGSLISKVQGFKKYKMKSTWVAKYNEQKNALVKDLGNFTNEYFEILKKGFEDSIAIKKFDWTSANHHYARLTAALDLAVALSKDFSLQKGKALLIGHSHAGQIFALLTQMIASDEVAGELFNLAIDGGYANNDCLTSLKKLKDKSIDFVTMGTPKRYDWKIGSNHRLLHIINHRGSSPDVNCFSGIFKIKHGDYVQLWATEGTDSPSPVAKQAEINRSLDGILDLGINLKVWKEKPKKYLRLHNDGHTLLIDYKDNYDNFTLINRLFGHGVYTRYSCMLYNLKTLLDYFYTDKVFDCDMHSD